MDDLISRQAAIDALKAHEDYKGYLHGDFEEILEALPSVQPERWIPCSERLPDKCQVVLLSINDGAIYSTVDYWTGDKFDGFDGDAVAWMPLPSPYKGEQE